MKTADKTHRQKILAALHGQNIPITDGDTVAAYVNHGRWVADCPCGGAELVESGEPMVCGSCGARHTVEWPTNIEGIRGALAVRPVGHQHWRTGESLDSLIAENIEHGIFPENLRKVIE